AAHLLAEAPGRAAVIRDGDDGGEVLRDEAEGAQRGVEAVAAAEADDPRLIRILGGVGCTAEEPAQQQRQLLRAGGPPHVGRPSDAHDFSRSRWRTETRTPVA